MVQFTLLPYFASIRTSVARRKPQERKLPVRVQDPHRSGLWNRIVVGVHLVDVRTLERTCPLFGLLVVDVLVVRGESHVGERVDPNFASNRWSPAFGPPGTRSTMSAISRTPFEGPAGCEGGLEEIAGRSP